MNRINRASGTVAQTKVICETFPSVSGDTRLRRWKWLLPALIFVSVCIALVSLFIGRGITIGPLDAWLVLAHPEDAPRLHVIAVNSRIPRIMLGIFVGAGLACAGVLMQSLTRNPLASSDLLGVTQGAVAAAVAWIVFGPSASLANFWTRPLLATGGGLVSAAITYRLSVRASSNNAAQFLLIGILVGGVFSSITTVSLLFARERAPSIIQWLSGSLGLKRWDHVLLSLIYLLPGILLLLLALPRANVLQLGDHTAVSLGQTYHSDKLIVLLSSVILTAGTVAVVGGIGFVGLIAPHAMRKWTGNNLRRLMPASALVGSAMVLTADLMSRILVPGNLLLKIIPGIEQTGLPAGIYLTLFGIPFLITFLRRT